MLSYLIIIICILFCALIVASVVYFLTSLFHEGYLLFRWAYHDFQWRRYMGKVLESRQDKEESLFIDLYEEREKHHHSQGDKYRLKYQKLTDSR